MSLPSLRCSFNAMPFAVRRYFWFWLLGLSVHGSSNSISTKRKFSSMVNSQHIRIAIAPIITLVYLLLCYLGHFTICTLANAYLALNNLLNQHLCIRIKRNVSLTENSCGKCSHFCKIIHRYKYVFSSVLRKHRYTIIEI